MWCRGFLPHSEPLPGVLVSTHLLAVRAGEVVRCCLQVVLQGFWGGVFIDTLHTPECEEKGQPVSEATAANPTPQADLPSPATFQGDP